MKLTPTITDLETITAAAVEKDPLVEEALQLFANLPRKYFLDETARQETKYPLLTPLQISYVFGAFLQKNSGSGDFALYINGLMQKSHRSGHNDFTLDTHGTPIYCLGQELQGMPGNNIRLTVTGDVRDYFGHKAEYTEFEVLGNAKDHCGWNATSCYFHIHGSAGKFLGWSGRKNTFSVTGDVGRECGSEAIESVFDIYGNAEFGFGSWVQNCTFNLHGNASYQCGVCALNSKFNIRGDAGDTCGGRSVNCEFSILGNVGRLLGDEADHSKFHIQGNAKRDCGYKAENCNFTIDGEHDNLGRESKKCHFRTKTMELTT